MVTVATLYTAWDILELLPHTQKHLDHAELTFETQMLEGLVVHAHRVSEHSGTMVDPCGAQWEGFKCTGSCPHCPHLCLQRQDSQHGRL